MANLIIGSPDAIIKTTPFKGAGTTVSQLREFIQESYNDPQVRQLTEKVCEGIQAKDYLSEYHAILRFVERNTRNMRDPRTVELVKNPSEIVKEILNGEIPQLDCDDMSGLICSMCASAGADTRLVTVAFKEIYYQGVPQFSHVFASALEPKSNRWIVLDPVAGNKTDEMLRRVKIAKVWNV